MAGCCLVLALALQGCTIVQYRPEVVIGTANAAVAQWVTMTESTTNDGVYTINLVTSTAAGAADDVVQLIGVADFGFEKDFTEFTFII